MRRRHHVILIVLILSVLTLARRTFFPIQSTATTTPSSLSAAPDISKASGFILEWRTNPESPRIAYRVSSQKGMQRVVDWTNAHARQLETSANIPPLAVMLNDYLWVVASDGAFREVSLVASYPADFTIPKAQRQDFIENLSASDFESLRGIFTKSGVVVKSPDGG